LLESPTSAVCLGPLTFPGSCAGRARVSGDCFQRCYGRAWFDGGRRRKAYREFGLVARRRAGSLGLV